jgi:hypothetical protein
MKGHADLGHVNLGFSSTPINVFAGFKNDINMKNIWFRFGFNYFGKNCESFQRLERDGKGSHFLSARTNVREGPVHFSLAGIFDLDNFVLNKYDAQVSYSVKDADISIIHLSNQPLRDV